MKTWLTDVDDGSFIDLAQVTNFIVSPDVSEKGGYRVRVFEGENWRAVAWFKSADDAEKKCDELVETQKLENLFKQLNKEA